MKLQKRKKKPRLIAISHKNRTLSAQRVAIPSVFPGAFETNKKNLNEYCGSTLNRRGALLQWSEGCWRVYGVVPTFAVQFLRAVVDCVCVVGQYSISRTASRIPTAINPQRRAWTGLFYLLAPEMLTIGKEFFLFFFSHFLGALIVVFLRCPLAIGEVATSPVRHWRRDVKKKMVSKNLRI
ncbi:hypothetical protein AVEN_92537-1 [Araneus ventricosus]|uniref:Uncharacterized protein n=1 Tax=Araneus ventricosus TaxID=182803 RepID=A0A4Y2AJI1_ARAVE|nr:hypothetical protein AVEN_92537-1 [Araneus ventricosus]